MIIRWDNHDGISVVRVPVAGSKRKNKRSRDETEVQPLPTGKRLRLGD